MRTVVIVGVILVVSGGGLAAQDPLRTAKDLYASAAYEDALSTLSRLDGAAAPEVARQADEYRAFCLYALGRTREAESVAEAIIRKQPLAHLDTADVSPRLELMFTEVRRRVLPTLIHDRLRLARAALDRKSFAAAEPLLVEAHLMIHEATAVGVSGELLADLSALIDGFLQLTRSSADQQPTAQPTSAATVVASIARPSSVVAATIIPRFYSAADKDVVPPVVLEQQMPALPRDMIMIAQAWKVSGVLRIVIDETGRVVDATIDRALDANLKTLVVDSARQWKYLPARKDGVAVRYIKTIALIP